MNKIIIFGETDSFRAILSFSPDIYVWNTRLCAHD